MITYVFQSSGFNICRRYKLLILSRNLCQVMEFNVMICDLFIIMIDHVLTCPVVPKEFELSVPVQRRILNFETFIVCYNFYIKGSSNLFLASVFKWLFAVNVESKITVPEKKRIRHSPCSICFLVELFLLESQCIILNDAFLLS